jgi:hypothetical protein
VNAIDYTRAFAPAPAGFTARLERTLQTLPERRDRKVSLRAALVAAILVILLAGAALALTSHWGILDFLRSYTGEPGEVARSLVTTGPETAPVTVGPVTFALTDAAYDGERLFVAVHAHTDGVPLRGDSFGSISGRPADENAEASATIGSLTDGGREFFGDNEDFYPTEDGLDLYSEFLLGENAGSAVNLEVLVYEDDYERMQGGALSFRLPGVAEAKEFTTKEPIALDGVTVTKLDIKYTPFRMYTDVTYTIDPALGKFDRMRRQGMFLFLYDENGREVDGLGGESADNGDGTYTIHEEWALPVRAHRALTIKLRGQDSDLYGEYTFHLEEE